MSILTFKQSSLAKCVSWAVSIIFSFMTVLPAGAQSVLSLPVPGAMITPTQAYMPTQLLGVKVFADNPLKFEFLINTGEDNLQGEALNEEGQKLIKYFLAALTVPEDEMWVNLSPYENNRIIPERFGYTDMGRDLLAQDYILKQLTASLMYPEDPLGSKFWKRVYAKAYQMFGTTDIPMNTFNKIWIVPKQAIVYEKDSGAYVLDNELQVMLEEDYIALKNNLNNEKFNLDQVNRQDAQVSNEITSQIVREIIIPEIEREVNEGKNFAQLRQICNAMVLATWYKEALKRSLLSQVYVDQNKVTGIDIEDKESKQKIYEQYIEAFKTGVYNYVKEDYDPATQQLIPRKYFSGGFVGEYGKVTNIIKDPRAVARYPASVRKRAEAYVATHYGARSRIVAMTARLDETGVGLAAMSQQNENQGRFLQAVQSGNINGFRNNARIDTAQLEASRGELTKRAQSNDPNDFEMLIDMLSFRDPFVRKLAVAALAERKDIDANRHLVKKLADRKSEVRQAAWESLQKKIDAVRETNNASLRKSLIEELTYALDPDLNYFKDSYNTAYEMAAASAASIVLALNVKDDELRERADAAVGNPILNSPIIEQVQLLRVPDLAEGERVNAYKKFASSNDPLAVEPVLDDLGNILDQPERNPNIKRAAVIALGDLSEVMTIDQKRRFAAQLGQIKQSQLSSSGLQRIADETLEKLGDFAMTANAGPVGQEGDARRQPQALFANNPEKDLVYKWLRRSAGFRKTVDISGDVRALVQAGKQIRDDFEMEDVFRILASTFGATRPDASRPLFWSNVLDPDLLANEPATEKRYVAAARDHFLNMNFTATNLRANPVIAGEFSSGLEAYMTNKDYDWVQIPAGFLDDMVRTLQSVEEKLAILQGTAQEARERLARNMVSARVAAKYGLGDGALRAIERFLVNPNQDNKNVVRTILRDMDVEASAELKTQPRVIAMTAEAIVLYQRLVNDHAMLIKGKKINEGEVEPFAHTKGQLMSILPQVKSPTLALIHNIRIEITAEENEDGSITYIVTAPYEKNPLLGRLEKDEDDVTYTFNSVTIPDVKSLGDRKIINITPTTIRIVKDGNQVRISNLVGAPVNVEQITLPERKSAEPKERTAGVDDDYAMTGYDGSIQSISNLVIMRDVGKNDNTIFEKYLSSAKNPNVARLNIGKLTSSEVRKMLQFGEWNQGIQWMTLYVDKDGLIQAFGNPEEAPEKLESGEWFECQLRINASGLNPGQSFYETSIQKGVNFPNVAEANIRESIRAVDYLQYYLAAQQVRNPVVLLTPDEGRLLKGMVNAMVEGREGIGAGILRDQHIDVRAQIEPKDALQYRQKRAEYLNAKQKSEKAAQQTVFGAARQKLINTLSTFKSVKGHPIENILANYFYKTGSVMDTMVSFRVAVVLEVFGDKAMQADSQEVEDHAMLTEAPVAEVKVESGPLIIVPFSGLDESSEWAWGAGKLFQMSSTQPVRLEIGSLIYQIEVDGTTVTLIQRGPQSDEILATRTFKAGSDGLILAKENVFKDEDFKDAVFMSAAADRTFGPNRVVRIFVNDRNDGTYNLVIRSEDVAMLVRENSEILKVGQTQQYSFAEGYGLLDLDFKGDQTLKEWHELLDEMLLYLSIEATDDGGYIFKNSNGDELFNLSKEKPRAEFTVTAQMFKDSKDLAISFLDDGDKKKDALEKLDTSKLQETTIVFELDKEDGYSFSVSPQKGYDLLVVMPQALTDEDGNRGARFRNVIGKVMEVHKPDKTKLRLTKSDSDDETDFEFKGLYLNPDDLIAAIKERTKSLALLIQMVTMSQELYDNKFKEAHEATLDKGEFIGDEYWSVDLTDTQTRLEVEAAIKQIAKEEGVLKEEMDPLEAFLGAKFIDDNNPDAENNENVVRYELYISKNNAVTIIEVRKDESMTAAPANIKSITDSTLSPGDQVALTVDKNSNQVFTIQKVIKQPSASANRAVVLIENENGQQYYAKYYTDDEFTKNVIENAKTVSGEHLVRYAPAVDSSGKNLFLSLALPPVTGFEAPRNTLSAFFASSSKESIDSKIWKRLLYQSLMAIQELANAGYFYDDNVGIENNLFIYQEKGQVNAKLGDIDPIEKKSDSNPKIYHDRAHEILMSFLVFNGREQLFSNDESLIENMWTLANGDITPGENGTVQAFIDEHLSDQAMTADEAVKRLLDKMSPKKRAVFLWILSNIDAETTTFILDISPEVLEEQVELQRVGIITAGELITVLEKEFKMKPVAGRSNYYRGSAADLLNALYADIFGLNEKAPLAKDFNLYFRGFDPKQYVDAYKDIGPFLTTSGSEIQPTPFDPKDLTIFDPSAIKDLNIKLGDVEQPEKVNEGDKGPKDESMEATIQPQATSNKQPQDVGGIDLNPAMMNLKIKRDGNGVPLPLEMQGSEMMDVNGFYPVIINVVPVTNLPLILGINIDEEMPADSAAVDRVEQLSLAIKE